MDNSNDTYIISYYSLERYDIFDFAEKWLPRLDKATLRNFIKPPFDDIGKLVYYAKGASCSRYSWDKLTIPAADANTLVCQWLVKDKLSCLKYAYTNHTDF